MSVSAPDSSRPGVPAVSADAGTSLSADAWRRLRRNRMAMAGCVALVLIVLACLLVPLITGVDPTQTDPKNAFRAPDGDFGTDKLGRDFLTRVFYGGRTSLLIGLVATLVSVLVGTLYGATAGYYGGRLGDIMMRIVDFLYGIPYMFLVILIMMKVQGESSEKVGIVPVFMALGLVQWLPMARIVRGQVLALRDQEFVLAARLTGASDLRIIIRHILPNVLSVVIIYATLTVPAVILLESFLSFLGLGLDLSWGVLVSDAVNAINPVRSYWWLLVLPSVLLALTLFSLNFVGDGLRDAFDPKSRR